ncbi:sensor histidine kinase [Roseateles oligotrophus]|uniref:PAS domain-containing protein n=1 Tax=Roseateles oligotrophus TaxID=1769250 RepID=A0ABT2YJB6_9BURK|nr:histidine kinase dimerization/phosphoacceptor domain -containing protein [Roseateles oligotrophus]MCV2370118.1 PAS domain-containing protein [Roseateles oligotrophus]
MSLDLPTNIVAPVWALPALTLVLIAAGLWIFRLRRQVAAQQRAVLALQEARQIAQALSDHVPGMLGYWTHDLRCSFANKEYLTWFKRSQQQMLGISMQELLGERLFSMNEPYIRGVLAGKDQQFERQLIRANGEIGHTWAQYIAHKVNGEVRGFVALVLDISELKKAEKALRESEAFNLAVLNSVAAEIAVLDRKGIIIAVNQPWRQFAEANGGPKNGSVGHSYLDNCRSSGDPAQATDSSPLEAHAGIAAVLSGSKRSFNLEYPCDSPTEQRWFAMNVTPLSRDEGGAVISHSSITQLKLIEAQLQRSLQDKTALLLEVHHRVKNNLQVITSLLRLEAGRSENAATKAALKGMQARIRSMSLLHETIYRSGTFAAIDLGAHIRQVASQSLKNMQVEDGLLQLHVQAQNLQVGLDQATACGLLVTELVSNCLKHGFADGRAGEIRIGLAPKPDSTLWSLHVSDNGAGLPSDFEARKGKSLGLQLVGSLATQMGGILQIGAGPTAEFTVDFEPERPAAIEINLARSSL